MSTLISRRGALGRLGVLLAAGAWPGALAAQGAGRPGGAGRIRFVVTNDFHHEEAACDPWFEAFFRQVAGTEGAAFCLGLGDLANTGKRSSLEAVARLSALAGMPFYPSPGNHDLDVSPVEGDYAAVFPGRRNYVVKEAGWQVVVIDSTEGDKWRDVVIADDTLAWLDATLPELDPVAPTVLATHFPLTSTLLSLSGPEAGKAEMCPVNADAVLARFIGHNLRGTFGGHFHGQTARRRGAIELVTNVCVARVRGNHDGTTFKGYWVVDGAPDGTLTRTFVAFAGV